MMDGTRQSTTTTMRVGRKERPASSRFCVLVCVFMIERGSSTNRDKQVYLTVSVTLTRVFVSLLTSFSGEEPSLSLGPTKSFRKKTREGERGACAHAQQRDAHNSSDRQEGTNRNKLLSCFCQWSVQTHSERKKVSVRFSVEVRIRTDTHGNKQIKRGRNSKLSAAIRCVGLWQHARPTSINLPSLDCGTERRRQEHRKSPGGDEPVTLVVHNLTIQRRGLKQQQCTIDSTVKFTRGL